MAKTTILEVTKGGESSLSWSDEVIVQVATGLIEAGEMLAEGEIQVVALHGDAVDPETMTRISERPVVVVEAPPTVERAVEMMRLGASDYCVPENCESCCIDLAQKSEAEASSGLSLEGTWLLHADLIEREKLATVGELARGLAHTINNPSAYVVANLNELRESMRTLQPLTREVTRDALEAADSERRALLDALVKKALFPEIFQEISDMIEESLEGMQRITGIVGSLQGFSRPEEEGAQPTDIPQSIETAVKLVESEGHGRARIRTTLEWCPPVTAIPHRIAQVFFDLLSNAQQSFEGQQSEDEVQVSCLYESGQVKVRIADNGAGIPEDILPRIWDPFFTIREGRGSLGLGLSICRDIVHHHGGEIEVESREGEGTEVLVRLPVPPEFQPNEESSAESDDPLERANLLLVDDEAPLLRSMRRTLRAASHIRTAESGREALKILAEGPLPDVVICDLLMPDLAGPEFYEQLKTLHPQLLDRLLFLTGGATTERTRQFLQEHAVPLLLKPVEPEELRNRIRALIPAP